MRLAYIDIGYNALRAVVYESNKSGSPEIFSEKFRSDILTLLAFDNIEVKHQTYLALQYLTDIFKQLHVTEIKCVATAILRDHPKAQEFKKIIQEKFNIEIEILSGEKEAYLTALGLISGINDANGIMVDLGGGSLELASIANKKISKTKSLRLGTKLMHKNNIDNIKLVNEIIKREFGVAHYSNLYFIGGGLRFISRSYMESVNYPLKNLHNLVIPVLDFEIYLEKFDYIYNIKPLSQYKSLDYYAVLVAKSMIEIFKPDKIIISNYGLKEGVRFVSLEKSEQSKDIIYERIKELLMIDENKYKSLIYKEQVYNLLVNPSKEAQAVINYAIMLSQFSKNIDKTLRVNFVVEFILACDIPFTHPERLMIALSLATAYNPKLDIYINKLAKQILSKNDYYNSQIIGHFIKIAIIIDGPEFSSPSFTLELKDPYIQILTAQTLPHQIFEKVFVRIKNIAYIRKIINNINKEFICQSI